MVTVPFSLLRMAACQNAVEMMPFADLVAADGGVLAAASAMPSTVMTASGNAMLLRMRPVGDKDDMSPGTLAMALVDMASEAMVLMASIEAARKRGIYLLMGWMF